MPDSAAVPPVTAPGRCAVHPSRAAHDRCPVCSRLRCLVDAETGGAAGCLACVEPEPRGRPAGPRELIVRAGLAGLAVALVGGWIATQYVRVHLMSLVAPALIGLAAGWAVSAAARGVARPGAATISVAAALLGTALGFRLGPCCQSVLHPVSLVGAPYAAAVLGVAAWPLLFGRPRGAAADRTNG